MPCIFKFECNNTLVESGARLHCNRATRGSAQPSGARWVRDGQSHWARCESVEAAQGKEKGSKAMGTSLCVFIDSSLRNWSGHLSCSGHAPWLMTWSKQVIHGKNECAVLAGRNPLIPFYRRFAPARCAPLTSSCVDRRAAETARQVCTVLH